MSDPLNPSTTQQGADCGIQKVRDSYDRRDRDAELRARYSRFSPYLYLSLYEREYWFTERIANHGIPPQNLNVLDIGAGEGSHMGYFRRIGVPRSGLWAAELMPQRAAFLKEWLDDDHILIGDASKLSLTDRFDIVFQATVFSSLLDEGLRRRLAATMWAALKPGGIILWYDFVYDNPWNKNVRGVPWREVRALFPQARVTWKRRVTLLPPLGRRIGRWYNWLNWPPLRSHVVATLQKPQNS